MITLFGDPGRAQSKQICSAKGLVGEPTFSSQLFAVTLRLVNP